jgi:large subunit ribosomal protein L13
MTTTFAKTRREAAAWHLVDASDEVLGRMATRVARILQGKHKPTWTPHADAGDFVVVVNAAKVQLTGRKSETKTYYDYSGYHGGLKHTTYGRMQERRPTEIVRLAVRRMLPKTDLGRHMLSKLKVFPGPEHTHHAQDPKPLSLGTSRAARTARKSKA